MRIAVIGAPGQLGSDVVGAFEAGGHEVHALGHDRIELADGANVWKTLEALRPRAVVNVAAYHSVEQCQDNPEQAFRVNASGAWHVSRACARLGASCLYVSTDYVFSGEAQQRYAEQDLPGPVNLYGVSKLAGEAATLAANPLSTVVRTSGLFGVHLCRVKGVPNFVDLMLQLASERGAVTVVSDEILSPSYTRDVAQATVELVVGERRGLFHVVNDGAVSWYDFAAATFEEAGIKVELRRATPDAFPKKAPRPRYSALRSERLEAVGVQPLRGWREALRAYLSERSQLREGRPA